MPTETRRGIVLRISSEGAEAVKAALRSMGAEGSAALRQLEASAQPVSVGFRAVDAAAKQLRSNVTGEFRKLSGAIVSAFSPVTLIASAISGVIGSVVGWMASAAGGTTQLEGVSDRLTETIDRLREVYGAAQRAQEGFTAIERTERLWQAQSDLRTVTRESTVALAELQRQYSLLGGSSLELFDQLADGAEDVRVFRERLLAFAAEANDPAIDRLAERFLGMTDAMASAEERAEILTATIAYLRGEATRAQLAILGLSGASDDFAEAMDRLNKAAAPRLSAAEQIEADFQTAMAAASTIGERYEALLAKRAALAQLTASQAADAAQRAAADSQRAAEREQQRLETLARTVIGEVNPALAAQLELEERLADIAELRARNLIDVETATLATAAAQQKFNDVVNAEEMERLERMQEATLTFLRDVKGELAQGATLWEAFAQAGLNALSRIADKLLTLGIDEIFSGLGKTGFGSGPIMSALLGGFAGGKATGGMIPAGRWGMVGERGPEPIFAGPMGALVLPTSGGAAGGGAGRLMVQIFNSGAEIREERSSLPEGGELLKLFITAVARDIAEKTGGGPIGAALRKASNGRVLR